MRSAIIAAGLLLICMPMSAQLSDEAPAGLASLELERSRTCVGVLGRVDELDAVLAPLATRSQRLLAAAQAVALEDRTVVDSLNVADPVEAQVVEWFRTDGVLAEQFALAQSPSVAEQRAVGREAIKTTLADALSAIQTQADAILEENQDLSALTGPCDGAIFVRNAVLEACQAESGAICDEATAPPASDGRFRFVDSAESMWGMQELRPWTTPSGLRTGPTGQLDGGRTVGYARVGNVVVSVAFQPLIRDLAEITEDELQGYQLVNDSLGLTFSHPDLAFAPALGIRVSLPNRLDHESRYVLHFGEPQDPDIVWTGNAGTGEPLEEMVPIGIDHISRLLSGEPLVLTAWQDGGAGIDEPAFAIELTNVNQAPATQSLLGYMARQLSTDLGAIVRAPGRS